MAKKGSSVVSSSVYLSNKSFDQEKSQRQRIHNVSWIWWNKGGKAEVSMDKEGGTHTHTRKCEID